MIDVRRQRALIEIKLAIDESLVADEDPNEAIGGNSPPRDPLRHRRRERSIMS